MNKGPLFGGIVAAATAVGAGVRYFFNDYFIASEVKNVQDPVYSVYGPETCLDSTLFREDCTSPADDVFTADDVVNAAIGATIIFAAVGAYKLSKIAINSFTFRMNGSEVVITVDGDGADLTVTVDTANSTVELSVTPAKAATTNTLPDAVNLELLAMTTRQAEKAEAEPIEEPIEESKASSSKVTAKPAEPASQHVPGVDVQSLPPVATQVENIEGAGSSKKTPPAKQTKPVRTMDTKEFDKRKAGVEAGVAAALEKLLATSVASAAPTEVAAAPITTQSGDVEEAARKARALEKAKKFGIQAGAFGGSSADAEKAAKRNGIPR